MALVNDSWRGIYQKLTLQLGQWQLLKVKKVRKRPDSEICSRLDGAQQMTILTREGQGPQAQISLWRKRIAQRFCDLINLTIPAHSWCEGSCNFGIGNQSLPRGQERVQTAPFDCQEALECDWTQCKRLQHLYDMWAFLFTLLNQICIFEWSTAHHVAKNGHEDVLVVTLTFGLCAQNILTILGWICKYK